jgi:lipoprotein-anchoring transpeptidase ErfK/SrfK
MTSLKFAPAIALAVGLVASCASGPPTPNPEQTQAYKAVFVNPYQPGTYEHFTAEPAYPKTYKVYKNPNALGSEGPTSITIDLGLQRAVMYKGEVIAMDYPVSSGKKTFPTPPGSYQVLEKLQSDKRSNLYGTIYDAGGDVHKRDADATKDKIPEGGHFKGASMPYWMRLSYGGIGMHRGRVPRYAASHGCIRMPSSVASTVFTYTPPGTPVSIVE